jgi:hypothetical protein
MLLEFFLLDFDKTFIFVKDIDIERKMKKSICFKILKVKICY